MKLVDMRCPACGGIIARNSKGKMVTCEYCGSRYMLDDEEDEAFREEVAEDEYEEDSSLSMAEYAEQACADFLASFDNGSFKETRKIVRGLDVGDGEDIYLIHDDTFMKSGKNGFAITDRGLYCRELAEEATFTDWHAFARLDDPCLDGSYVRCASKSVCYFTDDSDMMPELLNLYRKLHRHAVRRA